MLQPGERDGSAPASRSPRWALVGWRAGRGPGSARAACTGCTSFNNCFRLVSPVQAARAVPLPDALAAAAGGAGSAEAAGVAKTAGRALTAAEAIAAGHDREAGSGVGGHRRRLLEAEAVPLASLAAAAAWHQSQLRALLSSSSPGSSSPPTLPAPAPAAATVPGSQGVHPCRPTMRAVARQQPELQQVRALAAAGYDIFAVDGDKPNTVLAPTNVALQSLAAGACFSRGVRCPGVSAACQHGLSLYCLLCCRPLLSGASWQQCPRSLLHAASWAWPRCCGRSLDCPGCWQAGAPLACPSPPAEPRVAARPRCRHHRQRRAEAAAGGLLQRGAVPSAARGVRAPAQPACASCRLAGLWQGCCRLRPVGAPAAHVQAACSVPWPLLPLEPRAPPSTHTKIVCSAYNVSQLAAEQGPDGILTSLGRAMKQDFTVTFDNSTVPVGAPGLGAARQGCRLQRSACLPSRLLAPHCTHHRAASCLPPTAITATQPLGTAARPLLLALPACSPCLAALLRVPDQPACLHPLRPAGGGHWRLARQQRTHHILAQGLRRLAAHH